MPKEGAMSKESVTTTSSEERVLRMRFDPDHPLPEIGPSGITRESIRSSLDRLDASEKLRGSPEETSND